MLVFVKVGGIFLSLSFSGGLELDLRKTEVIKNCHRPLTPIDSRSFVGYLRIFMDYFISIAYHFITLTNKSIKFEWFEAC